MIAVIENYIIIAIINVDDHYQCMNERFQQLCSYMGTPHPYIPSDMGMGVPETRPMTRHFKATDTLATL